MFQENGKMGKTKTHLQYVKETDDRFVYKHERKREREKSK